jgi:hypothetical protein
MNDLGQMSVTGFAVHLDSAIRNPHFISRPCLSSPFRREHVKSEAHSAQQFFPAQSLNQVAITAEDYAAHSVLIGCRHIDS